MAGILKVDQYQDFNGNNIMTSDGSGNLTLNNFALKATPAFSGYLSASQTISDATTTKAQINAVTVDTDSGFDTSTNYRYTIPTGKAGKYIISYGIGARSTNNDIFVAEGYLYKNGSQFQTISINNNLASNAAHRSLSLSSGFLIMDLSAGDYLEVFAYIDCTSPPSGFPTISSDTNAKLCFLSGMRVIGA